MAKPRFNKTFVEGIVKHLYDTSSAELLGDTDDSKSGQEAHKRTWGAMQAMHWVSAGYGLDVAPPGARTRFMAENGTYETVTKTNVVTRLVREADKIRQAHEFTDRTGWNQVAGKGSYMNRMYGFWNEINTLIEQLGLIEVPSRDDQV